MDIRMKTTLYPVTDLASAKTVFRTLLGAEPYMDTPYYVAFKSGDHDIGLNPRGHAEGMSGALNYWHVDDIAQSLKQLLESGATAQQPVRDVGGGKLMATVKDADGNVLGLIQPGKA